MNGHQQLPDPLTGAGFKGLDAGRRFLADAIHRAADEFVRRRQSPDGSCGTHVAHVD
jgi:hypothetical protein